MSTSVEHSQDDGTAGPLTFAWALDRGLVRETNEDAVAVRVVPWRDGAEALVVAVADGLGGEGGGGIAAATAVDRIAALAEVWRDGGIPADWDATHRALIETFGAVDRRIRADAHGAGRRPGATTLVTAVIAPEGFVHAYTGDSRLYHRPADGELYRTRDQTLAQVYLDTGRIKSEAEATLRQRNTLFSTLGGEEGELSIEPEWETVPGSDGPVSAPQNEQPAIRPLRAGDTLLVCTDGLWGVVPHARIHEILEEAPDDAPSIRDRLMRAALDGGGADNIGVVVVRVAGGS